jgi:shikimate 5-dehydrogenase
MGNLSAPMNDDNLINTESKLFGFLAEYAQQNRFSVTYNRYIKEAGENGMCIPMNIRPDDIYFTVEGLKEAKLNGVAISSEYVEGVVEQLDYQSDEVKACGFCDTIIVKDKKLYGEVVAGTAIAQVLKEQGVTRLALLGSGKLAKSIVLHLKDSGIKELVLMNDRIESCMTLMQDFASDLEGISVDIDRAENEVEIDLSSFDGFISAIPSDVKLTKVNKDTVLIDMKSDSILADYAKMFDANFINNEKYSKVLARTNYNLWKKDI